MVGWNSDTSSSLGGDHADVTVVEGACFAVSAASGDMSTGLHGLYLLDTRILSCWQLTVDGVGVDAVSAVRTSPFRAVFVGRVPAVGRTEPHLLVLRNRAVGNGMTEWVELRNYSAGSIVAEVELAARSDFASLFDVKAGVAGGIVVSLQRSATGAEIVDRQDSDPWTVMVHSDRAAEVDPSGRLRWLAAVEPGGTWRVCAEVTLSPGGPPLPLTFPGNVGPQVAPLEYPIPGAAQVNLTVRSDRTDLGEAVANAQQDLRTLRIYDPLHPDRVLVAAGAPWYMTLFGRDALIAAWMSLPAGPSLALGVLQALADLQGHVVDPVTEEQPGRILHELRYDRDTRRTLGGQSAYYGSIDASLLFVMLVGELAGWGVPLSDLSPLVQAADAALAWAAGFGDRDGDGFVEYGRTNSTGLVNQGWKDSWDGVRHQDGSLAEPPIALAEVQGYAYAAYRARARLLLQSGDVPGSILWDRKADELKAAFNERFWLADRGWYAMALGGDKRPADALASNMGHCLWTGIVDDSRAAQVADLLVSPMLNSGFGLRTLASNAVGYNPLSYHCGSVWPHDTAVAIAGLARAGYGEHARALAEGLLRAASAFGRHVPELFGGFDRQEFGVPVPYPAACSPQAWASASPLLVLRALLGLEPDHSGGVVRLRPVFLEGMSELTVDGLWLGGRRGTLRVGRSGLETRGFGGLRFDLAT